MLKLGTQVQDITTNQIGMLTLLQREMNDNNYYNFQPFGCNPKDGLPIPGRWIVESAVRGGVEVEDPEIPEGLLGSRAEDLASGFEGVIVSLRVHLNGCLHVSLQSNKELKETNTVPDPVDFDIRRLKGDKIPIFATDEDLEKNKKEKPSPVNVKPYRPRI